jgi:VWFA-related protein
MKASTTRRSAVALVFLGCSLLAAGQQTPNSGSLETPVAAPDADRHITLDVVVADHKGVLISGLTEQDFTVLDNRQPQKLVSFRAVDSSTPGPQTQVILLIDAVNANFTTISYERSQIQKFLAENGGRLAQPVSLIFFADKNTQVQSTPTQDGNALVAAFDKNVTALRTITFSQGIYGAQDRLDLSISTLDSLARYEATKPGRKLLIWISPGWPILSGPRIQISNKEQEDIFHTVVALSALLRQAKITLYSLDPLGTADAGSLRLTYYEEFLKGLKKPGDAQAGNLALQVLATQSGGEVLQSSNDIAALIARATRDAGAYYELTYDPPAADDLNDYRTLKVTIDKPGLEARTRTGYYAQP